MYFLHFLCAVAIVIASVTSSNSKETVVSTEANTTVLLLSSEFSAVGWKRTMNETIYVNKHSAQLKAILCSSYVSGILQ